MKEPSQSRSKIIMVLGCFALLGTMWACDSNTTQPPVEPTLTTLAEIPTQMGDTPTSQSTEHSPTRPPQPTPTHVPSVAAKTTPVPVPTNAPASVVPATAPITAAPAPGSDPDLKPGFPVVIGSSSGNLTMVVGNIDDTPSEEIVLITNQDGASQLLALQSDGKPVAGWPPGIGSYHDLALGEFSKASPGLEIVSYVANRRDIRLVGKEWEWGVSMYTGSGDILPRWPITQPFTGPLGQSGPPPPSSLGPPLVLDLYEDGLDEVFALGRFLKADGTIVPFQLPARSQSAAGDLDNDGKPEIVTVVGGPHLLKVFHLDGSPMADFAPRLPDSSSDASRLVVGDVDGDGSPEIILVIYDLNYVGTGAQRPYALAIISADGQVKHNINFIDDRTEVMGLALGDLDCDGAAEIVLQTKLKLHVWKGDGTTLPGWPQDAGKISTYYSPLIGDINGDGQPDIVALSEQSISHELRAYNKDGKLLPSFPKAYNYGANSVPAIADIDKDGRNEIIVTGSNSVWAFDLHGPGPYGPVQWGQYLGGPQHQSYFKPGTSCTK